MGWQLEIAKMALYMSFPVGCFHYFNQPEYFEKWVIQKKQDLYPKLTNEDKARFEELKQELQESYERKALEAYEKQLQAKKS